MGIRKTVTTFCNKRTNFVFMHAGLFALAFGFIGYYMSLEALERQSVPPPVEASFLASAIFTILGLALGFIFGYVPAVLLYAQLKRQRPTEFERG